MKNRLLRMTLATLVCGISVTAADLGKTVIPTKHNQNLTLSQIADIQPGLGTVMMEFGHRFYIAYYAAKAGNWELAKYEIHELIEAHEIAETTRPEYAEPLKAFEHKFINPLKEVIKAKEWMKFAKQYEQTTIGCNSCHAATGHPFIKYRLPKNPPVVPSMGL